VPASAGTTMRALEQTGFFTGLGIVIVLLAAVVAGRVTAVPRLAVPAVEPTVPLPRRTTVDETETIG
jgi:hypothetical protein